MQDFTDGRFAARIAARNTPEHVRTQLTLRLAGLCTGMFLLGVLLCRMTPLLTHPAPLARIRAAIADPLSGCESARHMVRAVLRTAWTDISAAALLAVAGMTYFSRTACRLLLGAYSLQFGICTAGLALAVRAGVWNSPHGSLPFFLYFFARFAVTAVLLSLSAQAIMFSYRYRDAGRSLRHGRDTMAVSYTLCALSHVGTLLLLHTARAMLMHALC